MGDAKKNSCTPEEAIEDVIHQLQRAFKDTGIQGTLDDFVAPFHHLLGTAGLGKSQEVETVYAGLKGKIEFFYPLLGALENCHAITSPKKIPPQTLEDPALARGYEIARWFNVIDAAFWTGVTQAAALLETPESDVRSLWGKEAVAKKLKNDKKQHEKMFVMSCWKDWQVAPSRYASKVSFARDMLSKCVHLVSQKKIEDWCREWERGNGTVPV